MIVIFIIQEKEIETRDGLKRDFSFTSESSFSIAVILNSDIVIGSDFKLPVIA